MSDTRNENENQVRRAMASLAMAAGFDARIVLTPRDQTERQRRDERLESVNEAFQDLTAEMIGSDVTKIDARRAIHALWETDPRAALRHLVLDIVAKRTEPAADLAAVIAVIASEDGVSTTRATPLLELWREDRQRALADMLDAWLEVEGYRAGAADLRAEAADLRTENERLAANLADASGRAEWYREVTEARDAVIKAEFQANRALYEKPDGSPMPEAEILRAVIDSRDEALRALAEIGAVTPDGLRPRNPRAFWIARLIGPVADQLRGNGSDAGLRSAVAEAWVAAKRMARADPLVREACAAPWDSAPAAAAAAVRAAARDFALREAEAVEDQRIAGVAPGSTRVVHLGPTMMPDQAPTRLRYFSVAVEVEDFVVSYEGEQPHVMLRANARAVYGGLTCAELLRSWNLVSIMLPDDRRFHEMVLVDADNAGMNLAHVDSRSARDATAPQSSAGAPRASAGRGAP